MGYGVSETARFRKSYCYFAAVQFRRALGEKFFHLASHISVSHQIGGFQYNAVFGRHEEPLLDYECLAETDNGRYKKRQDNETDDHLRHRLP